MYAARLGDFKAHFITQGAYGEFGDKKVHETPLLFNLSFDPGEHFNIADKHPEVLSEIKNLIQEHQKNLIRGEDQLADRE